MDHSRECANSSWKGSRGLRVAAGAKVHFLALVGLLLAGCSGGEDRLSARFESPDVLLVTNRTGGSLEYSGHLLGGLHRRGGDFYVSVRNAQGAQLAPCGIFDPFTSLEEHRLAEGQTARFQLHEAQLESLHCMASGEWGSVVVEYAVSANDRRTVLFRSSPVGFRARHSAPGQKNPFARH